MREFGQDYLFRVSLKASSVWSKWNHKKVPPIYIVAANKTQCEKIAKERLNDDVEIVRISLLAKELSSSIYSGIVK